MKPYRLINNVELARLNKRCTRILAQWNDLYSLHPLSLSLKQVPQHYELGPCLMIEDNNELSACIKTNFTTLINYALFGEHATCYDATSSQLLLDLIQQLLRCEPCRMQAASNELPRWIYPGSTCLILELQCSHYHSTLLINPNWLCQELPLSPKGISPLHLVEKALKDEHLTLHLELQPMPIALTKLIELQIGDVLVSDQTISQPLLLNYTNQPLAKTHLGKTANYKSIIIKEFV